VLTAHPTEVQRKSILDAERAIAELVGRARRAAHAGATAPENEALLRARVTQLWQTRMLRYRRSSRWPTRSRTRCRTTTSTFLRADPAAVRELERRCPATRSRSFLRMGNWIGGDRDGNPNVTRGHPATWRSRARRRRRCAST
jgi:phosphoenolpyruvate carboxylase